MQEASTTNSRRTRGGWIALLIGWALILGSLPLTWFPVNSPVRDEAGGRTGGHVAVVRQWVEHPESISLRSFPEPKGPGFFAAATLWGRIFGTSCPALRSLIVVCAISLLAAWMWLGRLRELRRPLLVGLSLLVVPYVFIYTQMLHTEIPALLLAVLGLAFATKLARTGGWHWAVGLAVCLGAVLWVRQTFLVVPAALILCSPWMGRYRLRLAVSAAAACLAVVPMIWLWGGLVPPGDVERFTGGKFYWSVLAYALGVLGAMGWPVLLVRPPRRREDSWVFLAFGATLALALSAATSPEYTSPDRMGLLQKALISLPLDAWILQILLRGCICIGGMVIGRLVCLLFTKVEPSWIRFASMLACLTVGLCLVATPIFYDRYLILALVLIFAISAERARAAWAWSFLAIFAAIAVAHAAYVTHVPRPAAFGEPIGGRPATGPAAVLESQPAEEK